MPMIIGFYLKHWYWTVPTSNKQEGLLSCLTVKKITIMYLICTWNWKSCNQLQSLMILNGTKAINYSIVRRRNYKNQISNWRSDNVNICFKHDIGCNLMESESTSLPNACQNYSKALLKCTGIYIRHTKLKNTLC